MLLVAPWRNDRNPIHPSLTLTLNYYPIFSSWSELQLHPALCTIIKGNSSLGRIGKLEISLLEHMGHISVGSRLIKLCSTPMTCFTENENVFYRAIFLGRSSISKHMHFPIIMSVSFPLNPSCIHC
jgi:hypothetical protein